MLRPVAHSFSYLTLLHGAVAGACLLIALTHVLIMLRSKATRQRVINAATAVLALAAGAATLFELQKALATDVDSFLRGLFGEAVAAFVLLVALLVFTRAYFERQVDALFIAAMTVWVGSNIYQVLFFPGSFYSEIGELFFRETAWGEPYAKLEVTVSSFKYAADLGSLLVFAYIVTSMVVAMRRGHARSALIVGGSTAGFMLVAGILVPLDDAGLLRSTMPIGLPFLAVVAALTYQLISDRSRMNAVRLEIEQLRRSSLAGEISAGLMHELRQPLTSILSNAQAARRFLDMETPDLEEIGEALDDVVAEDKRAADIISGLRTFLGNEALETSTFDANSTVRRVTRILAGEFNTNGARLAIDLHSTPILVTASEVQLEQVLINLALNALRALRDKAPAERSVRFVTQLRDGYIAISVDDSGPGVAAEDRARIFEPFSSGSDSLGMGLAICRRIVDSHNGTIRVVDSDLGGASFEVVLPVTDPGET
jgi:signal transduction histidine kinase